MKLMLTGIDVNKYINSRINLIFVGAFHPKFLVTKSYFYSIFVARVIKITLRVFFTNSVLANHACKKYSCKSK